MKDSQRAKRHPKSVDLNAPVQTVLELAFVNKRYQVRVLNALDYAEVVTVGQLVAKTEREMLNLPYLGSRSLELIKASLMQHGLAFAKSGPETKQKARSRR